MRTASLALALALSVPMFAGDALAGDKTGDKSPAAAPAPKGDKAEAKAETPSEGEQKTADAAPKPEDENVSEADKEKADRLFKEGRTLAAEGNHAGACEKFDASQKLRPGIGVLFNLADCNEKLGKTGTAYRQLMEVVQRTQAALQADREKLARERLAALEPRLVKIRLAVPAVGKIKLVKLDADVIEPAYYNQLIVVDPGEHTVHAETTTDEGEPYEGTVQATQEGQIYTVAIPVAPGAKMKRNVGMIVGGSISVGIGGLSLLGAAALAALGSVEGGDIAVGPVAGLAALGVVGLGVGIPLLVVGVKKRPVSDASADVPTFTYEASAVPEVTVGLGMANATWHF
jgi:hypothetical protein